MPGMLLFFKDILRCNALWLLLFCLCIPGTGRAEEPDYSLDFIYVNANTGEATGGHSAIKLGSTVFHYQFFPGDFFLLVRDSWPHFKYIYTDVSNRTISIRRLPLRPEVFYRLNAHFIRLLISQQEALLKLDRAESGLSLLRQLSRKKSTIELPVAGLFDNQSAGNDAMASLRHALEKEAGAVGVEQMLQLFRKKAGALLQEKGVAGVSARLSALREVLLKQYFLQLVAQGVSLAGDALITFPDSTGLRIEELNKLAEYKSQLQASIVHLFLADMPGQAESIVLQTARYLAVSRSLFTRRLCTLDPFSGAAVIRNVTGDDDLQSVSEHLQRNVARARRAFFQETVHNDVAYGQLEISRGRLNELKNAILYGSPVRGEPGLLLPSRSGKVTIDWLDYGRSGVLAGAAEDEKLLAAVIARVKSGVAYDLLRRNCATELLRNINTAFANSVEGREALGGWLTPDTGFVFIPAELQTRVGEEFPVTDEQILLSRRLKMLKMLFRRENDMFVWLREANVFSSTLYSPRLNDSTFLFFTDDVSVMRPLLGLANIAWAALNGAAGLLTLPVDGGERIQQGGRGIFYSLPELVFHNIRKGTYGFGNSQPVAP